MINTKTAAQMLGLNVSRIRVLVSQGKIKGNKIGRDWIIDEKSVLARKRLMNGGDNHDAK